ncbi:hypothetical protein CHCC14809_2368 [Bacillus licheniformis]|nr:hypothetical protein B4094_1582 [Bacillus licheniformis]TWK02134.1 hypothetical protein CHCC20442_3413 [Bacillus licheniformis]TWK29468.1 hypothetical protein CHCC20369_0815 [Bacillus licheniformis]TWK39457.1 hypothetical protein CHCC20368_3004 [Bacillus licheniformis]TWK58591.1 hypothetical protein CHCC20342_4141 [Bacillus licheniformis]
MGDNGNVSILSFPLFQVRILHCRMDVSLFFHAKKPPTGGFADESVF